MPSSTKTKTTGSKTSQKSKTSLPSGGGGPVVSLPAGGGAGGGGGAGAGGGGGGGGAVVPVPAGVVPTSYLDGWDINLKKIVAGADSTHDMKIERMNASTDFSIVSSEIVRALQRLLPTGAHTATYTEWLKFVSNGRITHSNVEDDTVEYFETEHSIKMRTHVAKKVLTYREVIDKIKQEMSGIPPLDQNEAIYETNRFFEDQNDSDIMEMDLASGENWDLNYTSQEKLWIAQFILNFYFPLTIDLNNPANNQSYDYNMSHAHKVFMSFDAGSHFPTKLFGPTDSVFNLVTQLNIADSALTSDKHLGGKKDEYLWVSNRGLDRWYFTSNAFTSTTTTTTQIYLERNSTALYEKTTKFDFSLHIENPILQNYFQSQRFTSSFDSTHTSGPSVGYLAEMIQNILNGRLTTILPSCLDLNDIYDQTSLGYAGMRDFLIELLADLKRGGDAEQGLAVKYANTLAGDTFGRCILSTIDRLCGLESRMIEQNTFYFFGTKCISYRFPTNITKDIQIKKLVNVIKSQKKKIININENLSRAKTHILYIVDIVKMLYEKINTALGLIITQQTQQQVITMLNMLAIIQLCFIKHKIRFFINEIYTDNKNTLTTFDSIKIFVGQFSKFYGFTDNDAVDDPNSPFNHLVDDDAKLVALNTTIDDIQEQFAGLEACNNQFKLLSDFFGESITPISMDTFLVKIKLTVDNFVICKSNGTLLNSSILDYSFKLCQDITQIIGKITRLNGRSLSTTDISVIFKDSLFDKTNFLNVMFVKDFPKDIAKIIGDDLKIIPDLNLPDFVECIVVNLTPVLDEEGNPVVDVDGNPVVDKTFKFKPNYYLENPFQYVSIVLNKCKQMLGTTPPALNPIDIANFNTSIQLLLRDFILKLNEIYTCCLQEDEKKSTVFVKSLSPLRGGSKKRINSEIRSNSANADGTLKKRIHLGIRSNSANADGTFTKKRIHSVIRSNSANADGTFTKKRIHLKPDVNFRPSIFRNTRSRTSKRKLEADFPDTKKHRMFTRSRSAKNTALFRRRIKDVVIIIGVLKQWKKQMIRNKFYKYKGDTPMDVKRRNEQEELEEQIDTITEQKAQAIESQTDMFIMRNAHDMRKTILNYVYAAIIELIYTIQNILNNYDIYIAFTRFKNKLETNLYDFYVNGDNSIREYIHKALFPFFTLYFLFILFDQSLTKDLKRKMLQGEHYVRRFYNEYFKDSPIILGLGFAIYDEDYKFITDLTDLLVQQLTDDEAFSNIHFFIKESLENMDIDELPSKINTDQYRDRIGEIYSIFLTNISYNIQRWYDGV